LPYHSTFNALQDLLRCFLAFQKVLHLTSGHDFKKPPMAVGLRPKKKKERSKLLRCASLHSAILSNHQRRPLTA
jgi:hypothetical protein